MKSVFETSSANLDKLVSLRGGTEGLWQPSEFPSILQHQLDAPLEFDLTLENPDTKATLDTVLASESAPPKTFRELFHRDRPPLKLLRLTKEFAKRKKTEAEELERKPDQAYVGSGGPLPKEIALILYYTSIIVALVRRNQRITALDNAAIRKGAGWAIAQEWVDEPTRRLLREGLGQVAD